MTAIYAIVMRLMRTLRQHRTSIGSYRISEAGLTVVMLPTSKTQPENSIGAPKGQVLLASTVYTDPLLRCLACG